MANGNHSNHGTHVIDTHDDHVIDPVWKLCRLAHEFTGGVSTLLQWGARIPPLEIVHAEVLKARQFREQRQTPATGQTAVDSAAVPLAATTRPGAGPTVPHPLHHVVPKVR